MKEGTTRLWNIKEDVKELFHRPAYHIAALDGWRVLFNISVISLHVAQRFYALLPESGPLFERWKFHPYSGVRDMSSMQVDGFLLMSGLLFTSHMISTFQKNQNRSFFSFYPQLLFNRFLRLAPAIYVYLAILWFLSDPGIQNVWNHLFFMSNQLSSQPEQCHFDFMDTSIHLWSNSIEMQLFIVFSIIFFVLYKLGKLNIKVLLLLFFSSFAINYYNYVPGEVSAFMARVDTGAFGMLTRGILREFYAEFQAGREWFKTNYGITVPGTKVCSDAVYWFNFMKYLYMPAYARFSSFLVGCIISLHMHNTSKNPPSSSSSILWNILGWVLYLVSGTIFVMLALRPAPTEPNPKIDIFASTASRQLFVSAVGFLMYCTLVPESHPFHARFLKKLMGLSIWYPFSVLSYGSYIFHFRIQFFVVYYLMKPSSADQVDFYLYGKIILIVLPLTFLVAAIEHVLVEAPIARLRHKWFSGPSKTATKEPTKTQ